MAAVSVRWMARSLALCVMLFSYATALRRAATSPIISKAAAAILPSETDRQNEAKASIAVTAASASLMITFVI